MTTSVKYFTSDMAGAPPLSATAGALIALLDACLVDGFGMITATSLTVAAGVATLAFSGASPALLDSVILVAGSSIAELNGEQRVSARGAGTVSFATSAADGTASGTITFKLAPAGFSKAYAGTNKAAYRSVHAQAAGGGLCLRVDDSGTTVARVVGYEAMTDVDTGTGPFPTAAQISGGAYWPKAHNTTGTRTWAVVADGRAFYLYVQPTSGNTAGSLLGFGDLVPQREGDAWGVFLAGHASALFTGGAGCLSAVASAAAATLALPRAANGLGAAVPGYVMSALRTAGVSGHATGSQFATYPNPADAGLLLMPAWCMADGMRGRLPGLWHTPQAVVGFDVLATQAAPGYLPVGTLVAGAAGVAFVDVVGGWRG